MFVDNVSAEYDLDPLEEFGEVTGKWKHHDVKQVSEDLPCRKVLEVSPREKLRSLSKCEIEPMMAGCSASYKQNADGSWEVKGEIKFTKQDNAEKESDKGNESSAGQGTTAKDNDPPDSGDRNHGDN
jgi:hypothetical protein